MEDITNANPAVKDEQGQANPTNTAGEQNKSFTQSELDAVVKTRLAREREKYTDYETLKQKALKYDDVSVEVERLKSYESSLTTHLEGLVSKIDESKKGLIPDTLSPVEKFNYINKNQEILFGVVSGAQGVQPIQTPKPIEGVKDTGLIEGKYKDLSEFAQKDPQKYLAYRRNNPQTN